MQMKNVAGRLQGGRVLTRMNLEFGERMGGAGDKIKLDGLRVRG